MSETHSETRAATGEHAGAHGHDRVGHVVPLPILVGIFLALIALTYVTVKVTEFDFGSLNLWVAMGIATVKASLVLLYFMHLRYDQPINAIVFIGTLIFVFLFIGLALMDSVTYQPNIADYTSSSRP